MYAWTSYKAKAKVPRIARGHLPSSVIVWWGVSWNGATAVHFCMPEVKATTKICEETIFKPIMLYSRGIYCIFQQDSALAHKSKHCQEWFAVFLHLFKWSAGHLVG